MSTIYDVVADWEGEDPFGQPERETRSFGARRTREEAQALLSEQQATFGQTWRDFRIEEVDTTGLFEIPPRPTPRERFSVRVTPRESPPGAWRQVAVEVLDEDRIVGSYNRNYGMLRTFEPFRQGERHFALISPNYTATSVMDLQTGEIIAGEEPRSGGFCPVGFYVPDWWDIHERAAEIGSLPGSRGWTRDHEWPSGDFGFVWGCVWGDDSSWKVQYLDLSRVQQGELRREERFGYTILETGEREAQEVWTDAREFIQLWGPDGDRRVEFLSRQNFYLATGEPTDPWE
jgi:hypothetical protein